jgi:protein TonB
MSAAPARRPVPYPARQAGRRAAARQRLATRVVVPISAATRAFDPMARRRRGGGGWAALALAASLILHGSLGLNLLDPAPQERATAPMKIEVREPPPPPPPPEPEPPPPEPEPPKARPVPRKVAVAPPPPLAPPPPRSPPRVVGISLESTTGEGGGPSFAVGDTAEGKTERKAKAPVTAPPAVAAAEPAAETNRVSTRVPVAGVVFNPPKKRKEVKADYPDLLRAQGVEADVRLMVSIDATGHVTAVKVIAPATQPEFNEAARKAALEEEYEPATRNGTPIPYTLTFTSRFRLDTQ